MLVLRYWREIALGLAVAGVLGFVALAMHWRSEAAQQRLRADAAVKQAELTKATVQIVDHYSSETKTIIKQSEERADAIQAIPSDDLPADIRSKWLDGLQDGPAAPDLGSAGQPTR